MSDTILPSDTTDRTTTIRRYRLAMYAVVVLGSSAFVALSWVELPIIGVGAYWLGVVAFVAIWRLTDIQLFDERDYELERRASHRTLLVVAAALVLVGPALVVLEEATGFTEPVWVDTVLYTLAAQFGVFGLVYLWCKRR